jgi:hypothetical protein
MTHVLSLQDFNAHKDVHNFLQQELSTIHKQNFDLMQDVPHPWPSLMELTTLVQQSEGLFIYVSTLVKFISDRTGLPQKKLKMAMTAHQRVNPLYYQVLAVAQKFDYFGHVVGTIIYLHEPLAFGDLGWLLQLEYSHIQQALHGCQSIFAVPDTDQDSICPYHASLRDFLIDHDQSGDYFFDPKTYHVSILIDCLQLISMNENST